VPPEQFRGHAQKASDIYAMGATLYFILTGSDPEPISVASLGDSNVSVSRFLADLVERMTDQDPDNRPSDLDELARLLQGAPGR
jgi:serine/threonine protein kinase